MWERPGSWTRSLRVALGFLTTLPVPLVTVWRDDDLRLAVRTYPVVGAVLGVLLAGVGWALGVAPPLVAASLLVAAWIGLTGALHLDGLADVADAALAPRPVEERWTIVRDPRVGSFGLVATISVVLVKVAGITSLVAEGVRGLLALALVPVVARTAVVFAMAHHPVHDTSLLGRRTRLRWAETVLPLLTGVVVVVGAAAAGGVLLSALVLAGTAVVATPLVGAFLARRMHGLGGDAYGAIVEIDEALLVATAATVVAGGRGWG